ncbi:MAG: aldo/keto reductase [Clostridiales bacterium]|nr:aldo/keto reductase [Clostridiales bacterium]
MSSIFPKKKLGFGLMRLPQKDGRIDIQETAAMADEFLKRGYTYFDTAYVYAGSEEAFREAVVKRVPRESFTVADKMAGWVLSGKLSAEQMFEESLTRCGVSYFDYYLLHSLTPARMRDYEKHHCWEFLRDRKADGTAKHIGFSFHGDPPLLRRILSEHPEVEFVQLQINYADWESTAIWSGVCYDICREFGKEIVVMEPVKGGTLANLPEAAAQVLASARPGASPASFALRFVAGLPGVGMVLSGMSAGAQMADNLSTFDDLTPLSEEENAAILRAKEILLSADTIACTACRYCTKGCPRHIDIPEIFKADNMLRTFGEHGRPHFFYDNVRGMGSGRAGDCIACGRCEDVCPQHLPIISLLREASARLDK